MSPALRKSTKIVVTAAVAGAVAFGIAALPANASTLTTISGQGATASAASLDAQTRCTNGGGAPSGGPGVTQNADGSWIATTFCIYP